MEQSNEAFRSHFFEEQEAAAVARRAAAKKRRLASNQSPKKPAKDDYDDHAIKQVRRRELQQTQEDDSLPGDQYVDRAALRRQAEKESANQPAASGLMVGASLVGMVQQKNKTAQELSPEQVQQYFGGSDETTHAVKGLDTALLARVRADIARVKAAQQLTAADAGNSASDAERTSGVAVSGWARKMIGSFLLQPEEINVGCGKLSPSDGGFIHPLSKAFPKALTWIHGAWKASNHVSMIETRTRSESDVWYIYDLGDRTASGSLPQVLYRSRIGGGVHARRNTSVVVDDKILRCIMDAMEGRSKTKSVPANIQQKMSTISHIDNDDIFDVEDEETQRDSPTDSPTNSPPMDPSVNESMDGSMDCSEVLEEIRGRMRSAHEKLAELDVSERERKKDLLDKLERISQTALKPEQNPFSLQNASLIPLMKQSRGSSVAMAVVKSDLARPGESVSDKIDAEYGVTQVDIDDFAEDESICSARFSKPRRNRNRSQVRADAQILKNITQQSKSAK